MYYLIKKIKQ